MSYTPEQFRRRNLSIWTPLQAVVAAIQFVSFLVTTFLVLRYFQTGAGYEAAHISAAIKVVLMILITVTGMLWEFDVYGHYFLAKEFFWEDSVNAVALAVHLAFLVAWWAGASERTTMLIMLAALATYVINFIQFGRRGMLAARQRKEQRLAMGDLEMDRAKSPASNL